MATDRLALRRRRRWEPVKATARDRRHFRRVRPEEWRYTGLPPLRSKLWILKPLRHTKAWKRMWREISAMGTAT